MQELKQILKQANLSSDQILPIEPKGLSLPDKFRCYVIGEYTDKGEIEYVYFELLEQYARSEKNWKIEFISNEEITNSESYLKVLQNNKEEGIFVIIGTIWSHQSQGTSNFISETHKHQNCKQTNKTAVNKTNFRLYLQEYLKKVYGEQR